MEGQDQEERFAVMPAPDHLGHILSPSVDLFAREGSLGSVSRRTAHQHGVWHRVIGLLLYTQSGLLLLQQRSAHKDTNPLKWAMSVAGHISYGSSVEESVIAEAREEVGLSLSVSDMKLVGVFAGLETGETERYGKFTDAEYMFVYAAEVAEELAQFTLDHSEVQQVQFFPISEALDKFYAKDPNHTPLSKDQLDAMREWFSCKFP